MGWTSLHRDQGMTDRAFFEREFPVTLTEKGEILDCATVASVFYAAVRSKDTGKVWGMVVLTQRAPGEYNFRYKELSESSSGDYQCPARIINLLTPLPACHHDEEYCRLCGVLVTLADGQWISEARPGTDPAHAGPRCRIRPLGAAAPDGGYPFHEPGGTPPCLTCDARDWRERCLVNAEITASARARAKAVRPGTFVRFASTLQFTGGDELDTFIFEARSTFRAPGTNLRYRIPNWRTRQYEVIDPPGTTTAEPPAGPPGTLF